MSKNLEKNHRIACSFETKNKFDAVQIELQARLCKKLDHDEVLSFLIKNFMEAEN